MIYSVVKYLCFCCALIGFGGCDDSNVIQPSKNTEVINDNLIGPVKEVKTEEYQYEPLYNRIGKRLYTTIVKYDERGYMTEFSKWEPVKGATVDLLTEYYLYNNYYDESGVLIARTSVCSINEHSFPNFTLERAGLEERITAYNEDESVKGYITKTYNYDGNPIRIINSHSDNTVYQSTTFKYDNDGREIERLVQNEIDKNKKILLQSYEYTSYGKCRQDRYDDNNTKPTLQSWWIKKTDDTYERIIYVYGESKYHEIYDKYFNLTEYQVRQDNSDVILTERSNKYKYDPHGNWIEMRASYHTDWSGKYVTREIAYHI